MRRRIACGLLLALLVLAGAEARAQERPGTGSIFSAIPVGFTVRTGTSRLAGGGDVFQTFRRELSVSESAFDAGILQMEVSAAVNGRMDVFIGGTIRPARQAVSAAWQDTDEPDAPEQMTRLEITPGIYVGGRLFAGARPDDGARRTPFSANPYAAFGVGRGSYALRQEGRFFDNVTQEGFDASFAAEGSYLRALIGVGVDFALTSQLSVSMDAQRDFASPAPEGDFHRFESLGLSGSSLTLGMRWGW